MSQAPQQQAPAREPPVPTIDLNVRAGEFIYALLSTSLGPNGRDKMVVDSAGDVMTTNDGAEILKHVDDVYPGISFIVQASATTDSQVGDGTTSTGILIGGLLRQAQALYKRGVHPNTIIRTLKKLEKASIRCLDDISIPSDDVVDEMLKTTLSSKIVGMGDMDTFVKIVRDLAEKVDLEDPGSIRFEKQVGGNLGDSAVIEGIIIDKAPTNSILPDDLTDSKVLCISSQLEIIQPETNTKMNINSPNQFAMIKELEMRELDKIVEAVKKTGARVVLCSRGVDDIVQHKLERLGILAIRRVREEDIKAVAAATGATIVKTIDDIQQKDLGRVGNIEAVSQPNGMTWTILKECHKNSVHTIVLRGGNPKILDEAARNLHDALMVSRCILRKPQVVVGGGAPEIYIANHVADHAGELTGRENLVLEAFSKGIRSIPLTLAENAGMSVIDIEAAISRDVPIGTGIVREPDPHSIKPEVITGVYEPVLVKEQVIQGAVETTCELLKIDHMLFSSAPQPGDV